ncbi:MAG: 50S ribosomal protein L4 [Eubacteriales bacterium]|nr:50S ribosomal protein L4 [Eubacteriales bacterium]
MAKVSVFNIEGEQVGDIELNDGVFAANVNEHLIHKAVVHYLAERRQGTKGTKTRAEVRGGGRKPWRQKGTGHARQGSIRSPQWKGGGVVFAPKARDYSFKMNKKEKMAALRAIFTQKVNDGKFIVVDNLAIEEAKTKQLVRVLENLKAAKALVVTANDEKIERAGKNLPTVKTANVRTINAFDMLKFDNVVVDKALVSKIEEVYA